jgi:DNA-binding transcriptional LysR family regulator
MEMHQIRYFLGVCEWGTFSRAAEECGVTQPALTAAIKKLEDDVGGPLLHREGKRLTLSELGRMVKPHLEQVLGGTQAAQTVARNFRLLRAAPLRVGVLPTVGPVRLARFFDPFARQHPGIELAIREAPTDALAHELDSGGLDLAILSSPLPLADVYRVEPLYTERYVAVFPPGHRLERLNSVRLSDLAGAPYVDRLACEMRERVMATCTERNVELYAKFRSEREDWIQSMVLAGLGFAFMPEYSVTLAGLLSRPLADPPVERQVVVVDMRGRQRSPAAQLFVQALKAHRWPG